MNAEDVGVGGKSVVRGNRTYKWLDRYLGGLLHALLALPLRGNRTANPSSLQPRRILVAKLAGVGDAVLLVPALRALRHRYPNASIEFLGTSLTIPVVEQFPRYVDRTIAIDVRGLLGKPRSFLGRVRQLRDRSYDVAFDFEQWSRLTPLILAASRIPVRIGFRTAGQNRHALFTHAIRREAGRHEVDHFLSLVHTVTRSEAGRELDLPVDRDAQQRIERMLHSFGFIKPAPLAILHPGCGVHGFPREWPIRKFSELSVWLGTHAGAHVVVCGTSDEQKHVHALTRDSHPAFIPYIIEDLRDFVALLSMASIVVSGNTGAMHLAAALGVRQVALHGPTDPRRWGPLNAQARIIQSSCTDCPCLDLGFEYHRTDGFCMDQISVDEVIRACATVLAGEGEGVAHQQIA